MQEISAHRKRFDEAIFNVACHRSESMFASAGADSMTKVLVPFSLNHSVCVASSFKHLYIAFV